MVDDLHAGTTDILLDTSLLVMEEFGWTKFPVMVRKQTLRRVHARAGALTTVITMRMSL